MGEHHLKETNVICLEKTPRVALVASKLQSQEYDYGLLRSVYKAALLNRDNGFELAKIHDTILVPLRP